MQPSLIEKKWEKEIAIEKKQYISAASESTSIMKLLGFLLSLSSRLDKFSGILSNYWQKWNFLNLLPAIKLLKRTLFSFVRKYMLFSNTISSIQYKLNHLNATSIDILVSYCKLYNNIQLSTADNFS